MRAKDKTSTLLANILSQFAEPSISTVVQYEVEVGVTILHRDLWNSIFETLTVIPFRSPVALAACKIKNQLKAKGVQIDLADLFIAATAVVHHLPLATSNRKHFEKIDGLELFYPE
jgi:predicted nucleic acid-binding protein